MDNYIELNYKKNTEMLNFAVKYCKHEYSHEEIIDVLRSDNDLEKQYCLIILQTVKSGEEAEILVSNLTNHTGPVREACSYKISELIAIPELTPLFQTEDIVCSFVRSITDINPSVSRNAVNFIKYVENKTVLLNKIIEEVKKTLSEIREIPPGRSYDLNKKNFNLYWNLEGIISIIKSVPPPPALVGILEETAASADYTIREKSAKLVAMIYENNPELSGIAMKLKDDSNIYVRKHCGKLFMI